MKDYSNGKHHGFAIIRKKGYRGKVWYRIAKVKRTTTGFAVLDLGDIEYGNIAYAKETLDEIAASRSGLASILHND